MSDQVLLAAHCSVLVASLPNFAEDFASDTSLTRRASRHDSAGRSENIDPETAEHAWNLVAANIHAATGAGNTRHIRNRGFVVVVVLQVDTNDLVAFFFRRLVVRDVTLFLQDAGNLQLQVGSGYIHLLVPRADRVANSRQHVCDRIGQLHRFASPRPPVLSAAAENQRWLLTLCHPKAASAAEGPGHFPSLVVSPWSLATSICAKGFGRQLTANDRRPGYYHDDFETPGISPRSASPRKHRRQRPNLRRYARGRPQILQRLCLRVENLGFLTFCGLTLLSALSLTR